MTNYFSHDYNARNDPKLQHLQMIMKQEGKGIYWDLVEILHEQGGKIELSQCDGIAFALHTECDKIKQVIGLAFEQDDKYFWSNSALKRIKMQKEKSKVAKISASKRWQNEAKNGNATTNAVAMRSHSEGNAIKESKIKESKVNKKEYMSPAYLLNIPIEDFSDIEASENQIRLEGEKALNWLKAKGTTKKDYKAFLRNWVLKTYKKKTVQVNLHQELPETSEEQRLKNIAKIEEMKKKILGPKLTSLNISSDTKKGGIKGYGI